MQWSRKKNLLLQKSRQYLKSLFVDKGFISTFGVGYKFKF